MLVFDIGCNRGEYTQSWLQKDPECHVVCVDANHNFNFAYEAVEKTLSRITFVNKLVTAKSDGTKDFFIDYGQTGISTASREFMQESRFAKGSKNLPPNSGGWMPKPVQVQTITLDNLIEEHGHPDIIKIDVEGHEYEVICGLSQKVSMLHFEWHEEMFDEVEKSIQHLKKIGFKEFHISGYFTTQIFNNTNNSSLSVFKGDIKKSSKFKFKRINNFNYFEPDLVYDGSSFVFF